MSWKPLPELAEDVRSGKVTARTLVEKALKNIEDADKYNAILDEAKETAFERADEVDAKVKKGEDPGKLAGVPFIAKDNFLTYGTETTAASNILKGFNAPYQSTAINKLEEAGAIMVAKANLDSFGHGGSTENSDFGPAHNPYDMKKVPGGSSGGSAAAVALGLTPFAMATDTGGSIRQPASFTGTFGLKPTYGLISRFGVIAMASSTDTIGCITNSAEDLAYVVDILAGQDKFDSTTVEREDGSYTDLETDLKGLKVGVIKEHMSDDVDPNIRKQIEAKLDAMKSAGAEIKEISLPSLDLALGSYYIIMPAEVSSNLSRYDGIRFGYSHGEADDLEKTYTVSRSHGFNSENTRRIILGTFVLSSGYYDAYYKKAQTVRTMIIDEFNKAFEDVDVMVGPTSPELPFDIGAKADPVSMYLADIMTVGPSLVGIPAINVPIAEVGGLPVGMQVMASQRQDKKLIGVAKAVKELNGGSDA